MRVFRFPAVLFLALAPLGAPVACGSVPDLVFPQDGAVALPDARPNDGPTPDVRLDAPAGGPPKCPGPDFSDGVCCGSRPCINCTHNDCQKCNDEGCPTNEMCCLRGTIRCSVSLKC